MKIKEAYPPNFGAIKTAFPIETTIPIYPYGDTVYNPSKVEIPADILYHEHIHLEQQEREGSAALWWTKYIHDIGFRLDQELEAYAKQYLWVKKHLNSKIAKENLQEGAEHLSSEVYMLELTIEEAETMIRKEAKKYRDLFVV